MSARSRNPPHAATAPDHDDARLRGRTYAIPFDDVWRAALELAGGGMRGWRLLAADDREGLITAQATARLLRRAGTVEISIGLDADAQTRVDARSTSLQVRRDFGANTRRLRGFFERLDAAVERVRAARLGAGTAALRQG